MMKLAWLVVVCVGVLSLAGCPQRKAPDLTGPAAARKVAPPGLSHTREEPLVRVRIVANVPSVTISSTGVLRVGGSDGRYTDHRSAVTVTASHGKLLASAARTAGVPYSLEGFWVVPQVDRPVSIAGKQYQGRVRVEKATGRYAKPNHLDVIVHVPMETYLPGVLHAELYANWPLEAYKAQAIAARSYTYFEMSLNRGRTYDLESTVASQAYAGASGRDVAHRGANETRGVVLAWQGHVVPAFYSSTCGGVNQYAELSLPHGTYAGPVNSPRPDCTWCRESRYYRWGTMKRDRVTLSNRIKAWGVATGHGVSGMGELFRVNVSGATPAGRPTHFTLTDTQGHSFTLVCEQFRQASNFAAGGLPALTAENTLRSSHCRVTVVGQEVRYEEGRGFGHGVGMCQWGAQGMAKAGHDVTAILGFYYPGAELVKLY